MAGSERQSDPNSGGTRDLSGPARTARDRRQGRRGHHSGEYAAPEGIAGRPSVCTAQDDPFRPEHLQAIAKSLHNISVDTNRCVAYISFMNSNQFVRWLKKQGCRTETHSGGSGHVTVKLGDRKSQVPMHGGKKQLGTGLMNKIKNNLGLN